MPCGPPCEGTPATGAPLSARKRAPGRDRCARADRAPDGRVDGTRLFDAFRGPHRTPRALGAAAPNRPRAYGSCAARPTGRTYGTGLFLVRPDGYVGWTGDTPDGLGAYLARFGTR